MSASERRRPRERQRAGRRWGPGAQPPRRPASSASERRRPRERQRLLLPAQAADGGPGAQPPTETQRERDRERRRRSAARRHAFDIDGAAGGDGDQAEEYRPPAAQLRQPGARSACRRRSRRTSAPRSAGCSSAWRPSGVRLIAVVALALVSVTLAVIGPEAARPRHRHRGARLLPRTAGHRLRSPAPRPDAGRSSSTCRPRCSSTCRPTSSPASCSARCSRLRADVEDKINRLPLAYVDHQQRGDLLSRVTNDIDNVAQSLQQTLSQILTSLLTVVGVLVMMVIISPLLALIALVTMPLSLLIVRVVAGRSQPRFIAQWKHTGALNAQIEETFTGHALVKVVRPPARGREPLSGQERGAVRRQLRGPVRLRASSSRSMMFLGNLNYVAHRRRRRPAGVVGGDDDRRHPGVHPVLTPVHPAAHADGIDVQRAAVGHRLGRAGLRAARRRGPDSRPRAGGGAGGPHGTGGVRARLVLVLRRTGRSSRTSRSSPSPVTRSRSSDRPAPARPRS